MLTCFSKLALLWLICVLMAFSSGDGIYFPPDNRTVYTLDATAGGVMETRNNVVNLSVASRDANDLKAEYRAGFVQGKLQGKTVLSARDNTWDNAYLTATSLDGGTCSTEDYDPEMVTPLREQLGLIRPKGYPGCLYTQIADTQ
jgi:hypothetical protein